MVGTPLYTGDVCADFVYSILASQLLCLGRDILLEFEWVQNLSLVQCARNYLVLRFLENAEYTHLLWIDSDLGWQPDAIHRMVERGKDVIGGVYPRKADKAAYPYVPLDSKVEDGLEKAKRLPTGFLLTSRKAVEEVAADMPTFKMPYNGKTHDVPHVFEIKIDEDKNMVSEDYVFSDLLRAKGYDLWVERDIVFTHAGRNAWKGNLARDKAEGDSPIPACWRALHGTV